MNNINLLKKYFERSKIMMDISLETKSETRFSNHTSIVFSSEELEKFRVDPTRNPKTGRKISWKGKIYRILKDQLAMKDKNFNENESENKTPNFFVKRLKDKPMKP